MFKLKETSLVNEEVTINEFSLIVYGVVSLELFPSIKGDFKLIQKILDEGWDNDSSKGNLVAANTLAYYLGSSFRNSDFPKSTSFTEMDYYKGNLNKARFSFSALLDWWNTYSEIDDSYIPDWIAKLLFEDNKAEHLSCSREIEKEYPLLLRLLIEIHRNMNWDSKEFQDDLKLTYLTQARELGLDLPKNNRQAKNIWDLDYHGVKDGFLSQNIQEVVMKITKPKNFTSG
ncbi:hypothetical protein [Psychrosphaera algicola]|uniref:Uncharacterized protein n=1 Tax=Psychrosphaera algicola TaxID=3023714 RepID=A0ABT5FC47_9GAMM|nr:hypothetical protein [Psychrosphaera sp. G1-22]MDC2888512.1 hypothetical protein [Psychrosphaera sp. G1-22]